MKISFTDVKGQNTAPAHHGTADGVYKVDAFTGGYGSGAVRGINVSALESKGVDGSGNRTYIDPEAIDKVGGSYTWTNKKNDINITRYDNVGEGYKSPSHKLDFDEVVSNPAEFDYLRRKGVEEGYNGEGWSCVTERDKLPLVFEALTDMVPVVVTDDDAFTYYQSADAFTVGKSATMIFRDYSSVKQFTDGEGTMVDAQGVAQAIPSSCWKYYTSSHAATCAITNVTGKITINVTVS